MIPLFGGLTGLPSSIAIPASVVLTATVGGTINATNNYTVTFSTTCGGTFSSTTTPNNGPANPLTIGPVALSPTTPLQVTYNSTGATPGMCTLTLQLKSATGETTTNSFTVTLLSGFIHIYWTNFSSSTIGRANLDGTGATQSFISGASNPFGVAVDGSYIYWANLVTSTIGRANLDGTSANQSFISGANFPNGVAVDDAHIYWANHFSNVIGRANLDGTGSTRASSLGPAVPQAWRWGRRNIQVV